MKIEQIKLQIDSKMELIDQFASTHRHRLLFATVSGAHLYGFPSADSDVDLRGVHCIGWKNAVSLKPEGETVDLFSDYQGMEMDLVTHDVKKFMGLMLKRNGYVLEQLFSPLVVQTSEAHEKMKELGLACITRHHAQHYMGFAKNQWKLFCGEEKRRVKPLLYCFRVLLTGIHLMKSGKLEANLSHLNDKFRLPYLDELMKAKMEGPEKCLLHDPDNPFYEQEFQRLDSVLRDCYEESSIQENPSADTMNDLLVEIRSASLSEQE